MLNINYNPDVLTCLANLSNDEVFTPPDLVNQMLDMLPAELWTNKEAKFLDPVTKSGVFLREITKRLIKGLEAEIPDLQTRLNHILTKQVYGIAITELTSLLARRSVYCAKRANHAEYSMCTEFEAGEKGEQGNIRFERIAHTWTNGKCSYCGASQEVYDRADALETHAYQFIHCDDPKTLFEDNMKFDVIIGNPPYQLSDGGNGASASPIYQRFVEQAKKLNPRYLSMIIPSRWFAGGKGLDDFRVAMLNDSSISKLVDYPNAKECFPNNSIGGGVCYFLRDLAHKDKCEVVNVLNGQENSKLRKLNQFDVFVRYNQAISIIQKIRQNEKTSLQTIVSSRNPFGFSSKDRGEKSAFKNAVMLFTSQGRFYVNAVSVLKGNELVKKHKVMISKVTGEHAGEPDKGGMFKVLSRTELLSIDEICTDSYLCIGSFDGESEAKNLLHYLATRFVRFLLLQAVTSINLSADKFAFIPMQNFNEPWTDEKLYAKYGLSLDEIAFIESMIRPMDLAVVANDAINDAVEVDDE